MTDAQIIEMARQSGGEFYEGFAGSTNFVKFTEDDFEKFAELIVRECCDIVGAGGEFASRPKLVEKLQEHFGVEE